MTRYDGVVLGMEEQRRNLNAGEIHSGRRPPIVIRGTLETKHGRNRCVIKLGHRLCRLYLIRSGVSDTVKALDDITSCVNDNSEIF